MRVLRYIVRFLGISLIILWLLASFVRADDNVTVNFPDQMSVSGSVEITNLGINGDPEYDLTAYPDQVEPSSDSTTTTRESNVTTTYISGYTSVNIVSSSLWNNGLRIDGIPDVTLKFPNLDFGQLKVDFFRIFYGTKLGTGSNFSTSALLCGLYGGRANLGTNQVRTLDTVVTDQFGSATWSFTFPWRFIVNPNNLWDYNGTQNNFDVKLAITTLLYLAAWFEVIYLIIGKISRA